MSYDSHAVIGIGFGDEGKGMYVNTLCSSLNKPLVIRYSGGQQAAHTVYKDNIYHVFSNFGSGTLQGAPTYWSKYCTFDPIGTMNEFNLLIKKGVKPVLFLDKQSPITTPYDLIHNQQTKKFLKNGTCGVGIGATHEREEKKYSLTIGDLLYDSILETKLNLIREYYGDPPREKWFLESCKEIKNCPQIHIVDSIPEGYDNYIFEGSQGLLLDPNIGFFPHVTRSNIGSKNILEMGFKPNLYLITRAFQTRHGNGPMTNTYIPHRISSNPHETNKTIMYQGEFRKSLLDLDLLKYGIEKDNYIKTTKDKKLVITCMDLIINEYKYTIDGKVITHSNHLDFKESIADFLKIKKVILNSSPYGA